MGEREIGVMFEMSTNAHTSTFLDPLADMCVQEEKIPQKGLELGTHLLKSWTSQDWHVKDLSGNRDIAGCQIKKIELVKGYMPLDLPFEFDDQIRRAGQLLKHASE